MLNGEKWFVTSEGEPGFYIVLAVADGEQTLFLVEPDTPGLRDRARTGVPARPVPRSPPRDRLRDCRVPEANRVPSGGNEGAKEWFLVERLFIAARCCGAAERLTRHRDATYAQERDAFGSADRRVPGRVVPARRLAHRAARGPAAHLPRGARVRHATRTASVVHGKVSIAKLYASEMAGRVADRALQVLGGRGYMTENPAARFYREVRVDRIWEGTSEIQRLILARGLLKRGAAPYLD